MQRHNTVHAWSHVPLIKQKSQLLSSHVSTWQQYSSEGNRFDFSCENCKCSKVPIGVSNVPLSWLSCDTIWRFGVDTVLMWQAWITQHNEDQYNGVWRYCSGNRSLLSRHSQYKFFKKCSNFPEFLLYKYIYINIYIYIYIYIFLI